MISLNNLLKSVVESAEEYHQLNEKLSKIEAANYLTKEETKKEVVIINPTHNGYGDFELARKLEKLITSKGLQVAVISLAKKHNDENFTYSYENISGKPTRLESKLVVIAPFSFCKPEALLQAFKNNVIINEKMKIVMIDEMEASSQHAFPDYKREFEKIDVKHVYEEKLGFGENCIGYLPIEESECVAIKQRSKIELKRLFDSFNLNVDASAHYYISYLNSDAKVTESQVFIVNTLYEVKENPSSVNYLFSLGKDDWESDVKRISEGVCKILSDLENADKDIANKFSKLNTILVDAYKNKTFHTELQNRKGEGIPINIIFMNSGQMPKNIWHNFIAMSKSGVMTGDQSLGDYLSIKKEMPFYEMQYWKWPLKQSLINSAETFRGKEFKKYVETKFFGRLPPYGKIFYQFADRSMLNDQLKSDFQDFGKLLSEKVANGSIEAYLKDTTLLESDFSTDKVS